MFFMAKIRITDSEDNQIADNTEVSTVNDSLFSALKSMPHFGYQSYFSKKLASDESAVNTYLTTEGYFVR